MNCAAIRFRPNRKVMARIASRFVSFEFNRSLGLPLEEEFEPAVVVPRQRGHNAFLANFAPVILVEQVSDTREHSGSPLPKFKFGREIPNIICGNKAFEGIAIVTKFIVNERAKKRDFEGILIAIDRAGLELLIRRVSRRVTVIWPGSELGI
jgi:ribosomal protein L19